MRALQSTWWLVCAAALSGCSADNGTQDGHGSGDGGDRDAVGMDVRSPNDVVSVTDGATPTDSRMGYCMGEGPPVMVGDADGGVPAGTCAASIAARVFSNAVCSCTDASIAGYFQTRSFDSGMGGVLIAEGGPVGLNNTYNSGSYTDVGGTFSIDGINPVHFLGYLKVGGDMFINAGFDFIGYTQIHRDLWMNGNTSSLGLVTVGRDVHVTPGHAAPLVANISGHTYTAAFTVPPPCDCAPGDLLDIAGIVAEAATGNDNASVGLDPATLSAVVGIGVDLTLPCGRFYVNSVGGLGGITLNVPGRTALFVGGDVNAIGAFNVHLGPMGELDLFIGGNLLSIGAGSFGSQSRPAATRIYVAGTSDVVLVGASGFVGNVYAPRARITAVGATTVYGSLFGRLIDMPGYLDVHYDRAILGVGHDCPHIPGPCTQCSGTCSGMQACVSGACAPCTSDSDCCAPLVCYSNGTCQPLLG